MMQTPLLTLVFSVLISLANAQTTGARFQPHKRLSGKIQFAANSAKKGGHIASQKMTASHSTKPKITNAKAKTLSKKKIGSTLAASKISNPKARTSKSKTIAQKSGAAKKLAAPKGGNFLANCNPSYSDGPDNNNFVDGIDLNTLNTQGYSYTSGTDYSDYTSESTDLQAGQTYTLTVFGSGSDNETFGAWIDLNQDGDFDSSELIVEAASSGGQLSITFTAPTGGATGPTLLRVLSQEDYTSGLEPCGSYAYGECEDYTVNIVPENVTPQACIAFSSGPDAQLFVDGIDLNGLNTFGNGYADGEFYKDYTSNTATIEQGTTYVLTVKGSGSDNEVFGAWIDLNQDGTFDSDELITEAASSGGQMTITFAAPTDALLGPTVLRVIAQQDLSEGLDPCGVYTLGEAEDYSVDVVAASSSGACTPQYSTGPNSTNYVEGIELYGDNSTSISSYGNGFVAGESYVDYTQYYEATLSAGPTYTLTINGSGSDNETFAAWIDLNQDGTYDSGELIGEFLSNNSYGSITFSVPSGTPAGYTTIRVLAQGDGVSSGPCGPANSADGPSYGAGEAEDYSVYIDDATTGGTAPVADFKMNPSSGKAPLTVQFTDQSTGNPTSWNWVFYKQDGTPESSASTQNTSHTFNTAGVYWIRLNVTNAAGTDYIDDTVIVNAPTGPQIAGQVSSYYGKGWFVQGVPPVVNTLTANGTVSGTTKVTFKFLNVNGNTITSVSDNSSAGGWNCQYDMSLLPKGSAVKAEYYNSSNALIGYSPNYDFNIIPKPEWFVDANMTNLLISGGKVNMDVMYSLNKVYSGTIPTTVAGLAGSLCMFNQDYMSFKTSFDMNTRATTVTTAQEFFGVNFSNYWVKKYSELAAANEVTVDTKFNLVVNTDYKLTLPGFEYKIPYKLSWPVAPGMTVALSASVGFKPYITGRLVIGNDVNTGKYGFLDYFGNKTKQTAAIEAYGKIKGSLEALWGVASLVGDLTAKVRIGFGFKYVSVPSVKYEPLFGGDLDISGKISVETLWGYGPGMELFGPKSFYSNYWGDYAAVGKYADPHLAFYDVFGQPPTATTNSLNGDSLLPFALPQPSFGKRDSNLYTTWIERQGNDGYILLSKLNKSGSGFSDPIIVAKVDKGLGTPKIGMLSDGSALITWTQNRVPTTNIPNGISIMDLMAGQDIWMAVYDVTSNSITSVGQLGDDNSGQLTGRLEGNPTVTMGQNNEGLITWITADTAAHQSDIWYVHISKGSGGWTTSIPEKLVDYAGSNKSVNVSFVDNTNAMAVWINDADGDATTIDSQILNAIWDGNTWSSPYVLSASNGSEDYESVSMSYNNYYCGVAWTSKERLPAQGFTNYLTCAVWDDIAQKWDAASELSFADSAFYFSHPRISISNSGKAILSYQETDMFPDSNAVSIGTQLYYLAKDIASPNTWDYVSNQYLCDTTKFVWYFDNGFADNDRFYVITQEYDNNGPVSAPKNGILFGDPGYGLVLRGVQVNNDLSISDIQEPVAPTGIKSYLHSTSSLEILSNYPNPFIYSTTIKYQIKEEGIVSLKIYDVAGHEVATLMNERMTPGLYQTEFNKGNLDAGVYFYKLNINSTSVSGKMTILR